MYLFQAPVAIGSGSYIKLRLPEGSTARFEDVLVQRGCLKDGPAAVLDELARSVRDDSHLTAVDLSDKADACVRTVLSPLSLQSHLFLVGSRSANSIQRRHPIDRRGRSIRSAQSCARL